MNILAINPDSLNKPTGGLGIQFKELHERLKDKVSFYIAAQPEDKPIEIPNYTGVIHPMPSIKHGGVNTLIGNTAYLAAAMKFPKPDLVHAMDWSVYLAGAYAAEIFGVPLVVSMNLSPNAMADSGIFNCADFNVPDGKWLHKSSVETEYYGLMKADKIIHVSRAYAQNKVFKNFKNKEVVIPNGIDLSKWVASEKEVKLPGTGKYKVIYIGRFTEMKSVIPLLEAEIPEEVDLIFVGDYKGGDIQSINKLKDRVAEKKNVYYIGAAYEQDKIDILCAADAVIMPSSHEPFGIVGLEAMASKSIMISSRIDGLGDFLNDFNSIYCGSTKQSISDAFRHFVNLSDEDKQTLIANGIKTCEKYNWDIIADQYLNVYKNVIEEAEAKAKAKQAASSLMAREEPTLET